MHQDYGVRIPRERRRRRGEIRAVAGRVRDAKLIDQARESVPCTTAAIGVTPDMHHVARRGQASPEGLRDLLYPAEVDLHRPAGLAHRNVLPLIRLQADVIAAEACIA